MEKGFTVPGMPVESAEKVRDLLQERLVTMIDLELTLKHVHWNVVGPNFIGVHEMFDPHVAEVRAMADELAERIAALGGSPVGTPGYVAGHRRWDDYDLARASAMEHLAAIDKVYEGVVADQRKAIDAAGELDPVTEGLLVDHAHKLEQFQWFVRAHLDDGRGHLVTEGAETERAAAARTAG